MVIPAKARKKARIDTGDVVSVLPEGDGRLVLVRMERPKAKPRNKVRIIRRKGKHPLLSIRRRISRGFIPDDFSPRMVATQSSRQFTDLYLAELAEKHPIS